MLYSPEEMEAVAVQQWMFVPNLNGQVYEAGKVFAPEGESKTDSATVEVLTESDTVVSSDKQ